MLWDKPGGVGAEALAHMGWSLSGFRLCCNRRCLMVSRLDTFALQEDGLASAEVDIGWGEVL
jgi:hypothetical protein